jgi:hypothetical protein
MCDIDDFHCDVSACWESCCTWFAVVLCVCCGGVFWPSLPSLAVLVLCQRPLWRLAVWSDFYVQAVVEVKWLTACSSCCLVAVAGLATSLCWGLQLWVPHASTSCCQAATVMCLAAPTPAPNRAFCIKLGMNAYGTTPCKRLTQTVDTYHYQKRGRLLPSNLTTR